ncbi:MAG TPA: type II secretion system protein [Candidatus Paceibacterota bacterium]|nr:type II secretion system protein [Candidatus Paceibacterota bacterium]
MYSSKGFTLIELLVVIAIIGVLSSVVLASLNTARSKARDVQRVSDMQSIRTALELYATSNNGDYPSTGNSWVWSGSGGNWIPNLSPLYISRIPLDPVNSNSGAELTYYYNSNGTNYCMQFSQEDDCSRSPYYWGVWSGSCKLRTGTGTWCSMY